MEKLSSARRWKRSKKVTQYQGEVVPDYGETHRSLNRALYALHEAHWYLRRSGVVDEEMQEEVRALITKCKALLEEDHAGG